MLSNISSWPGELCSARDCFFVPIHFNPSCISSHCPTQFKSSTFTLFDSRQLLINCNHAAMLTCAACVEEHRYAKYFLQRRKLTLLACWDQKTATQCSRHPFFMQLNLFWKLIVFVLIIYLKSRREDLYLVIKFRWLYFPHKTHFQQTSSAQCPISIFLSGGRGAGHANQA